MQAYHIIVGTERDYADNPISDHQRDTARDACDRACCEVAGGFTRTVTIGGWIRPRDNQLIGEAGYQYTLCIGDDGQRASDTLAERLAVRILEAFNQQSVILILPGGDVHFIDRDDVTPARPDVRVKSWKDAGGTLSNGATTHIYNSPNGVVLAFQASNPLPWVTWQVDVDGRCYHGRYFPDQRQAARDFIQRIGG